MERVSPGLQTFQRMGTQWGPGERGGRGKKKPWGGDEKLGRIKAIPEWWCGGRGGGGGGGGGVLVVM